MVDIRHEHHKNASTQCYQYNYLRGLSTAELHLPGLIGTTSHPDMQKIRVTGFFF